MKPRLGRKTLRSAGSWKCTQRSSTPSSSRRTCLLRIIYTPPKHAQRGPQHPQHPQQLQRACLSRMICTPRCTSRSVFSSPASRSLCASSRSPLTACMSATAWLICSVRFSKLTSRLQAYVNSSSLMQAVCLNACVAQHHCNQVAGWLAPSTAAAPQGAAAPAPLPPPAAHLSMSSTTDSSLAVNLCSSCSTSLVTSFLCSSKNVWQTQGAMCGVVVVVVVIGLHFPPPLIPHPRSTHHGHPGQGCGALPLHPVVVLRGQHGIIAECGTG